MDRRNNQFIELERGSGMVGWAVKQLMMWLIGGLVVYFVVVDHQLFIGSAPETKPQSAVTTDNAAAGNAPTEVLRPLGQAVAPAAYSLSLRARPDGYAYVTAAVNGADMVMAFDTGASAVALTQADAIKAGVAGNLNYSLSFSTADGRGRGAPVMLREIRIGQLVIQDVQAVVMQDMQVSLLGQTFLHRLHSYQMRDGVLTLTWQ
jgi:clan AA aspartic protease (TIGR02281 family)